MAKIGPVLFAIAAIVTIVLGFLILSAQGQPASPTAVLGGSINPGTGGTVQVTMKTQFDSLVGPNTIFQPGGKFVYSVTYTNAQGGTNVLAANQSAAFGILTSTGSLYTMGATISVVLPSICSPATCAGMIANLTVTEYAVVQTYWATWYSPTTVVTFSSYSGYTHSPAIGPTNSAGFNLEFWGVLGLLIATDLLLVGIAFEAFPVDVVALFLYIVTGAAAFYWIITL